MNILSHFIWFRGKSNSMRPCGRHYSTENAYIEIVHLLANSLVCYVVQTSLHPYYKALPLFSSISTTEHTGSFWPSLNKSQPWSVIPTNNKQGHTATGVMIEILHSPSSLYQPSPVTGSQTSWQTRGSKWGFLPPALGQSPQGMCAVTTALLPLHKWLHQGDPSVKVLKFADYQMVISFVQDCEVCVETKGQTVGPLVYTW